MFSTNELTQPAQATLWWTHNYYSHFTYMKTKEKGALFKLTGWGFKSGRAGVGTSFHSASLLPAVKVRAEEREVWARPAGVGRFQLLQSQAEKQRMMEGHWRVTSWNGPRPTTPPPSVLLIRKEGAKQQGGSSWRREETSPLGLELSHRREGSGRK